MNKTSHLWAVGFDDMERADQIRAEIVELGWGPGKGGKYLVLDDIGIAVRHSDGSFTFDRMPFPAVANILGSATAGFLAGLVMAAPLTGAAIGALLGSAGTAAATHVGISEAFVRDVEAKKRDSTRIFLLDDRELRLHVATRRTPVGADDGDEREHLRHARDRSRARGRGGARNGRRGARRRRRR